MRQSFHVKKMRKYKPEFEGGREEHGPCAALGLALCGEGQARPGKEHSSDVSASPGGLPRSCSALSLGAVGGESLRIPGPRKCSESECPIQTSYSKGSLALLPDILQGREPGNFSSHYLGIS